MKQYLIVLATCLLGFYSFAQQNGSVLDSVNGRVYKTVKIGEQVWMTENFDGTKFQNGDIIPHARTAEEWKKAGENKQPAWSYLDNGPVKVAKCGKWYNWYAVNDPRGLAPDGWHIPTAAEWYQLKSQLGDNAGEKMKSTGGWNNYRKEIISYTEPNNFVTRSGNGSNSSGFSGLPCIGYPPTKFGDNGEWWSSSEEYDFNAATFGLESSGIDLLSRYVNKEDGLSVRCIKGNVITQQYNKPKNENSLLFLEEDSLEPLSKKDRQIVEEKIDENKVYDEVDVDRKAEYFFGFLKWNEFISANIDPKNINKKCIKAGTYKAIIGFIVNTKGQIQYISPLSTNGCGIEEEAIRVINKAIKWEPAMKNGNYVTSYTKKIIEIKIEK